MSSEFDHHEFIKAEAERRLCEQSLYEFMRHGWHVLEPGNPFQDAMHLKALCEHLEAVTHGRIKKLIANVCPGFAKPCHVDGMVLERTRGRIRLGDVSVGDEVLTHRGRFRRVDAVYSQGLLPVMEIITFRGRVIKVEGSHPVLTTRGWVAAEDLTPSDFLAEVHKQEPCGTNSVTAEEARLLGYLIGDGCLKYDQVTFTNQDAETINDFIFCAKSMGFDVSLKESRSGNHKIKCMTVMDNRNDVPTCPNHPDEVGTWRSRYCKKCRSYARGIKSRGMPKKSKMKNLGDILNCLPTGMYGSVKRWKEKHNLSGKCSYTKAVPQAILSGTDEIVAEFLSAYWACDGGIEDRRDLPRSGRTGQVTKTVRISCCTVSDDLASGFHHLLTRLGMSFNLRRDTSNITTKKQGDKYKYWRVSAWDQDNAAKFMMIVAPKIRHEKRIRCPGTIRSGFDSVLVPDQVKQIKDGGKGHCRCLTVEEDHSFVYQDIAVKNSMTCCVFWPAWEWIHKPETRWLFVSYSDDFAMRDSVKTRTLIKSEWYQSHWRDKYYVKYNADAKSKFENSKMGFRQSTSIQGGGTGSRADRVCIDDPLKIEEAYSQTERDKVNKWYDEVGSMRGSDPRTSTEVIVHQRLHVEDITGHLLKSGNHVHFFVPLEFDPGHVCETPIWKDPRTIPGDCCWPARFTPEIVAEKKKTLGFYGGQAQLQQRPEQLEGGIIRKQWFCKFVQHLPKQARRVRSWDLACLVAGTMIETIGGQVPIENIKAGDLVMTRDGYKEVEWSGMTKKVKKATSLTFSNGATICGTADHKIWSQEHGWLDVDKFGSGRYSLIVSNNGDYLCRREVPTLNSSSLTGYAIEGSQERNTSIHGGGTRILENILTTRFTEPFGDSITGPFLKVMTSITRMAMSTITTFLTLNACRDQSTPENTERLMNGICDPKQSSKGLWLGKNNGTISLTKIMCVSSVNRLLSQGSLKRQNFAQSCAVSETGEALLRNARFVNHHLSAMDIAVRRHVETNIGQQRVNVAGNSLGSANKFRPVAVKVVDKHYIGSEKEIPVYDLTVKDAHEFFANGVLVHNSTAGERSKGKVCFTASVLMSRDHNGLFYVEEVLRGKWDSHERDQIMIATAHSDRSRYGAVTTVVEREGGSSGKDQEQAITKLLYGFEVWFEHPTGPKDTRIMAFASQLGAGNVYFPMDAPWFADYVQELCLIRGTKITTKRGEIPIETVTKKDFVLTRGGWKEVYKAELTSRAVRTITISVGECSLTGTFGHPVWVDGRGWVSLGEINPGDELLCLKSLKQSSEEKNAKKYITKGPRLEDSLIQNILEGETTFGAQTTNLAMTERFHFIEPSIYTKSAQYQKNAMSTIKMAIPETMIHQIWKQLGQESIPPCIILQGHFNHSNVLNAVKTLLREVVRQEGISGVAQNAGMHHEQYTEKQENLNVLIVRKDSSRIIRTQDFVAGNADYYGTGIVQKTTESQRRNALFVERYFGASVESRNAVQGRAVKSVVINRERSDVFNLEVKDCHEYFANGILVHNCSIPHGDFWDQVDATSAGFNNLSKTSWFAPAIGARAGGSSDERGPSQSQGGGWWSGLQGTPGGLRDLSKGGFR